MPGARTGMRAPEMPPGVPQTMFSALIVLDALLRYLGGNPVRPVSWPALAVRSPCWRPWRPGCCPGAAAGRGGGRAAGRGHRRGRPGPARPAGGGRRRPGRPAALWLGRMLGRRGAVVALVACVLLMVVPGFLYLGTVDAGRLPLPADPRRRGAPARSRSRTPSKGRGPGWPMRGTSRCSWARRWPRSRTSGASPRRSSTPSTWGWCCSTPTAPTAR